MAEMSGEETMGNKSIEELRALAFASMPRKGLFYASHSPPPPPPPPLLQQHLRGEKGESREEGEVSSDEGIAGVKEATHSPSPSRHPTSATGSALLYAVTSGMTTFPAHLKTMLLQKGETVSTPVSCTVHDVKTGMSNSAFVPAITSVQRLHLHTDYGIPAPTRLMRSERFGMKGEKNDSLVIKFSAEDSDSDVEPQQTGSGQIKQDNLEDQKSTGQTLNLSNQSTKSLKSEIDRMKRQIATIERFKGKRGRLSKFSLAALQQDGHHISRVTTGHTISRSDLENLRQQIAVKENELQQQKRRAAAGSGSNILCTHNLSEQEGYSLNFGGGSKASIVGPSVANTAPGKSTEREILWSGLTENPTVDRSIIYAEEISQDVGHPKFKHMNSSFRDQGQSSPLTSDLLVARASNTFPQENELSDSHKRESFEVMFPESCKDQHELFLSATDPRKTVVLTDAVSSKFSVLTSSEHVYSDIQQTGVYIGVKKQRLNELSSHAQPSSSSGEKNSLDDVYGVNLKQIHMPNMVLLSTLSNINDEMVEVVSKERLCSVNNGREFSNHLQVVEPSSACPSDGSPKFCKEGENQRNEAATSTSHLENSTSMVILSDDGQDTQKLIMGGSPDTVRYPFWSPKSQVQNHVIGLGQGVSDQEIEFGTEEIRQLMEEEEMIDKQLEEAQQDRFNCEAIERLARRNHREAQVNLQAADIRCGILHQKREVLAARVQAAETQYYSNRASTCLPMQHHQGFPLLYGRKEYSLKELKKSEVDVTLAVVQMSETQCSGEDYRNSESGNSHHDDLPLVSDNDIHVSATFGISLAESDMFTPPQCVDQQQDDSAHCTSGVIPRHSEGGKTEDGTTLSNKGDVKASLGLVSVEHLIDVSGSVQQHKDTSVKSSMNILNHPSKPIDCKYVHVSSKDENPEAINVTKNSDTLLGMINSGAEKELIYGFSSASFATNTNRVTPSHLHGSTRATINNGHDISGLPARSYDVFNVHLCSSPLNSSPNQMQQCSDAHENSLQSIGNYRPMENSGNASSNGVKVEDNHMHQTPHSSSVMKTQDLGKQSCDLDGDHNLKLHTALDRGKSEFLMDGKDFDIGTTAYVGRKSVTVLSGGFDMVLDVSNTSVVNMDNLPERFMTSVGGSKNIVLSGKGRDQINDFKKAGSQKRRKMFCNQSCRDLVSVVRETKYENALLLRPSMFVEGELHSVVKQNERAEVLHSDSKRRHPLSQKHMEASHIPICTTEIEKSMKKSVPSKLKSLFNNVQGITFSRSENKKIAHEKNFPSSDIDWATTSVPSSYISPLVMFRSYRICSQFSSNFNLPVNSDSWSHCIDPFNPMCKFEHRGKCNNDDCPWQHKRDYTLSKTQFLSQLQDYSRCCRAGSEVDEQSFLKQIKTLESSELTAERAVSFVNQTIGGHIITRPIISEMSSPNWSSHLTKPPLYRINSYLIKGDNLLTLAPVTPWAQQCWKLGFFQSFSMTQPINRRLPLDMPCLLNSSVADGLSWSTVSSPFCLPSSEKENMKTEAEEHFLKGFEEVESLLEISLRLINFRIEAETSEGCTNALYILSRALEKNPNSEALWIVYLHMYHLHEKNISKDDMFLHAVLYSKESYVLWLWFINSRKNLRQKLDAFQMAITELSSACTGTEFSQNEKSSYLLDISLQMINYMCMSGLIQEAICWIDDLISYASEDNELHTLEKASVLSFLCKYDACILWVCCGYIIAHAQLPDIVLRRLGYKQQLLLGLNWENWKITKSCKGQLMILMQTAASHGRGCLAVEDADESLDRDTLAAKQAMAVNFMECAIACDVDIALVKGEKFMELYPTSVELVLTCIHVAELNGGKSAGVDLFEAAIFRWPHDKPGILCLWSQYIAYAYAVEDENFVKDLLERCVTQVEHNEPWLSVSVISMSKHSDDEIRHALQSLPSVVNHKFNSASTNISRAFSNEDVVSAFLILAFFEFINKDIEAAQIASGKAMMSARSEDDIHRCLKEVAALSLLELDDNSCSRSSIARQKILCLLDKWCIESRLLITMQPLSRRFCDSFKRRRVRLFVENILGPSTVDYSFLNSILEICYGPTLVPGDDASLQEVFNFVEGVLELVPANVPIAASACKIVHRRLGNSNLTSKTSGLLWSISLLMNALCNSVSLVAEFFWLEAGNMLEQLGVGSFLEDFYQCAVAMCPFSTSLWHRVLAVFEQTGKLPAAIEAIKEIGLTLDLEIGSHSTRCR